MEKSTQNIRYKLQDGYAFVRNLKGDGVIDACFGRRAEKKVARVFEAINDDSTFSGVWDELILIKGADFTFKSN